MALFFIHAVAIKFYKNLKLLIMNESNYVTTQESTNNYRSKARFILLTLMLILAYSTVLFSATYYIDPTNTASNQNGSISNPYNSWTKVSFANGNTYLQKKGTTYTTTGSITINGKSNITIGSYGSGSNAKIVATGSGNHIFNITGSSGISINDLEISSNNRGWISGIIIQGTGSSNNLVNNCLIRSVEWGVRVVTNGSGNKVMNSTIHDIGDDGIYVKDASSIEIGFCNIYDVNKKYLTNPDQSYSAGDGIQIASTNNMNFNIHDNIIDHSSMGNKFCIIAWGNNYTGIIENNVLIGNSNKVVSGIYLSPTTKTVTVRYNEIRNSNYGIYSYAQTLDAYYNSFAGNKVGISVLPSYNLNARNNVFYNNTTSAVSSSSNTSLTLKNNIFNINSGQKAIQSSGSVSSNNNIFSQQHSGMINGYATLSAWTNASGNDAGSQVGNPSFVNPGNNDFHVQNNSVAVNKGANVNLSRDFFGGSVPQSGSPDCGIHEVVGGTGSGNSAPVITNQAFSIAQNASIGSVVGTVVATDPNAGQTIVYSIVSGNTNSVFAINASSGTITVAKALPLQNFNLTVKVTDNGSPVLSSQATVSINVSTTSGNQAPVIANQSFTASQSLSIGAFVGKVVASDPDQGQTISYSIVSGNTNAVFALNASTGNITVAKTLPAQTFNLVVKVTDNGSPVKSSQATVTIQVTPNGGGNQPPYLAPATFTVKHLAPNGTFVGKLTGSDPNAGQSITYTVVSGNTNNAFAVNRTNGAINVKNSSAVNMHTTPKFTLKVKVTDNGQPSMSFTQTIIINVVQNKTGDDITSTEETEVLDGPKEMRVYPNPSTDGQFSVAFGKKYETVKLEVFDIQGRLIKTETVTESSKSKMDLSTSPSGAYLIRLDTGAEKKVLKAIKY